MKEIINYLASFVTDERLALFKRIVEQRTNYMSIVLEDIFQSHNASAVLRSCDCFGIQQVHIIENKNKYQINPDVALGSSKWLNLVKYTGKEFNTVDALKFLKTNGYRIVATTPHTNDVNLDDFDITKGKFALLFGTELQGLSKQALYEADEFLKIPMVGFTESLNISVCAAITIHHLSLKLRNSSINWQLTEIEKDEIMLNWLKISIKDSTLILKEYYKRKGTI